MENNRFAKLANRLTEAKNHAERHTLIKDALDYLAKEFNIEFGDFKVYVRQGKASERIEINKSFKMELKRD